MANAAQHAAIGAVASGTMYLVLCRHYKRQPEFGELLFCAGAGLFAAGVPDLLEPAMHPHHRQFAHSLTIGGLLAKYGTDKCGDNNGKWDQFHKMLLACLIVGYLSHLIADACTPRGLPLLGNV